MPVNLKTTIIRRFYARITPRITRIIRVFPAGFLVIPALKTPDSGDNSQNYRRNHAVIFFICFLKFINRRLNSNENKL
jgi:hypothetical protein